MPYFYRTPVPSADPIPPDDSQVPLTANDFLTPEDIADRSLRRRRWIVAVLLLALMVGGGFAAKPGLHAIKAWRARGAAAEAERLINEHNWYEAKSKLQDALQFWRQEPAAQRAAAIFLARTGNMRESAAFWKQVEVSRLLTTDEQREYAAALLAGGDLDAAEARLHKAWPAGQDGTPTDWELALQIARRRNHVPEVAGMAQRLLASPQATGRQRFNAAVALLVVGDRDVQGKALDEMLTLARDQKSPESLDALIILAQNSANLPGGPTPVGTGKEPFPTLAELIARIESHSLAKTQHRLLTLDLQVARDPARRTECIQTAIDRFADSKEDADLALLGGWLYSKKEYDRVLKVIPDARAAGDRTLFSQRLDALAALECWSEVREAIQNRKGTLDPMIEQMFLARCAEKLNEPQVRDARWDAALDAAGGKLDKLLQLGQYAKSDGALDVAEKAFRAMVLAAPESREAYSGLAEILAASGNTAKLRETLVMMKNTWPTDASVQNDVAYFDALLNENVRDAVITARQLVRNEPRSLPHRVTLALAELRSGNNLAALDAFSGIGSPQNTIIEPRQRAVYAAALWSASYNKEAHEVMRGVALERLLPEERTLVRPIETR